VDANGYQEWDGGPAHASELSREELVNKWRAFGWASSICDGHNCDSLKDAFDVASSAEGPVALVCATKKGKGSALLESNPFRFHCDSLSDDEHAMVIQDIKKWTD
jgi:transketolase